MIPSAIRGIRLPLLFLSCEDTHVVENWSIVKEKWHFFRMNGVLLLRLLEDFSTKILTSCRGTCTRKQTRTSFTTKWQSGLFKMRDLVSIGPTRWCKWSFKNTKMGSSSRPYNIPLDAILIIQVALVSTKCHCILYRCGLGAKYIRKHTAFEWVKSHNTKRWLGLHVHNHFFLLFQIHLC